MNREIKDREELYDIIYICCPATCIIKRDEEKKNYYQPNKPTKHAISFFLLCSAIQRARGFRFFSVGFRIWNEQSSVSSTDIMAPALSKSPQ